MSPLQLGTRTLWAHTGAKRRTLLGEMTKTKLRWGDQVGLTPAAEEWVVIHLRAAGVQMSRRTGVSMGDSSEKSPVFVKPIPPWDKTPTKHLKMKDSSSKPFPHDL